VFVVASQGLLLVILSSIKQCDSQQGDSSAFKPSKAACVGDNSIGSNHPGSIPALCTVCDKKLGRSLGTRLATTVVCCGCFRQQEKLQNLRAYANCLDVIYCTWQCTHHCNEVNIWLVCRSQMLNQITGGSKLCKISCVQHRMLPEISKNVFPLPVPTEKKEKQLTCKTICHKKGSTCVKPQKCLQT